VGYAITPPSRKQATALRNRRGCGVVGCNMRRSATIHYERPRPDAASAIIGARFPTVLRMQLLFDFFPLVAFFAAFKLAGMYVATAVLIAACALQVALHWIRTRRVNKMHLVTAGLALVFGGLTLAIHDTAFIKWKFSVVNWLFGAAFLGSSWRRLSDRPLVQRMMGTAAAELRLSDSQWRRLNGMWVSYFLLLGTANLVAIHYLDDSGWMNFKFYGTLLLTAVFIAAQALWIASQVRGHDKPAR
jgi:intracellular septation protein